MNRADLQSLSDLRVREAQVLFEAGQYCGAYYLAGYAVECALKACYAKTIRRFDFPDRNSATKVFSHRPAELARLAAVDNELNSTAGTSTRFQANWKLICSWTEASRYAQWTRTDAEEMLDAITNPKDGVLPWIKRRW